MSTAVSDSIRKVTQRAKLSALFFIPGCILFFSLSWIIFFIPATQSLGVHRYYVPAILLVAPFIFGLALATTGLVFWILTWSPLFKSIQMVKAEGREVSWTV